MIQRPSEPIFARTRHEYASYGDFWRLVTAAGFPTCYVDEINLADDTKTYIFTPINGEVMPRLPAWRTRRCKIVWWNLERPEDETLPSSLDAVRGSVDAIWVSDRVYAGLHRDLNYARLAGHVNLGARTSDRRYDVCHLAYVNGRRGPIVNSLLQAGLRIAPEAYGREAQDRSLACSHVVLNTHQYDGMYILAPIRFAVAASYAIPIVSEPYRDAAAHALCAARASTADLTRTILQLLATPDRLRESGDALHEALCRKTDFGCEVRVALAALEKRR